MKIKNVEVKNSAVGIEPLVVHDSGHYACDLCREEPAEVLLTIASKYHRLLHFQAEVGEHCARKYLVAFA